MQPTQTGICYLVLKTLDWNSVGFAYFPYRCHSEYEVNYSPYISAVCRQVIYFFILNVYQSHLYELQRENTVSYI